jgi:hypothetical protein
MPELVISTFDFSQMSIPALRIAKAAVLHASENPQETTHTLNIADFCSGAGLPIIESDDFSRLLKEARKTLAIVEVIDTSSPERDDLPYCSWPVFNRTMIDHSKFTFEICRRSFDERLLATLP